MASFDFRDAKHDKRQALFSDEITPLWMYNITTGKIFPIEDISNQGPGDQCGIIVESL